MAKGPLDGIRVMDLTQLLAGPFATKLLADYGADVIKLEPPEGEPGRRLPPFPGDVQDIERSGTFFFLNTNKRSVVLDLRTTTGQDAFRDIARTADIVVESLGTGVLDSLDLGYDALRSIRPDIVMLSISDFGHRGPYKDWKGSDLVLYAMGGEMHSTGLADRPPLKQADTVAMFEAGATAAVAAMAGLTAQRVHGLGQWIDFSLYEALASSPDRRVQLMMVYQFAGLLAKRPAKARHFMTGTFPCKDGFIEFWCDVPRWPRLMDLLGHPNQLQGDGWGTEAMLSDPEKEKAFERVLLPWLKARTREEVWHESQAHKVLVAPVYSSADFNADPYYRARGYWEKVSHPAMGEVEIPGRPFSMGATGWELRRPAPLLGEHTEAVLRETAPLRPAGAARPVRTDAETDLRPLAGIRVLDLAVVWTGPFGTMLLGDLGAEVIKLENVHRMQPYTRGPRRLRREDIVGQGAFGEGYPDRDPGERPYERDPMYLPLFRNKRSVTIDLRSPRGKEHFRRLAAKCDVLFENNVPETLEKLGITYDTLREINPAIIVLRCPAFGGDGAYKNYRGWGNQVDAMPGGSVLRGYADLDPTSNTGVFTSDYQTGAVGAFAVLAALHQRARTGEGQLIELAQVENSGQMFPQAIMDYVLNGRVRRTTENRDPGGMAPTGVYPCAGEDRWVAISVWNDDEWRSLAECLGRPELADDDRFRSAVGRLEHHDELDALLRNWTASQESHDLAARLQASGVRAGPVQDASEALHCPHLRDRGFFERVEHRFTGTWDWPGMVFQMPVSRTSIQRAPVGLGEDNEYVYRELIGLSGAEYQELLATGDIGTEFDEPTSRPAGALPRA